ncbi:MAG TPA: hypothetical protein VK550_12425 [Polyangiaceae bacterium]|nr:hypothetical protein [Polyangiaceae bacterium]
MRKVEFDRMQELRSMITAVAFAASTDDERPDMNGVGLEVFDGELHARATNGEWAMRVRRTPVRADEGFKCLVPLSHVKRLVALIGDGIGKLSIVHDQELVRFDVEKIGRLDLYTGGVAAVPFADIDGAWPTGEALPMDTIGLNPSLMASLAKAFGQLAEKPTLRFAFHGDEHPIVVTCEEQEYADALLMPCILKAAGEDDDEEDRQRTLFPEREKGPRERVAEAMDGIRNAVPGAEMTISSGGHVIAVDTGGTFKSFAGRAGKAFKGKTKPKVMIVKKGAAAKKKKTKAIA